MARNEAADDLIELRSYMKAPEVKEVYREEHIRVLEAQVPGNAITLAALRGTPPERLAAALEATGQAMKAKAVEDKDHVEKKLG